MAYLRFCRWKEKPYLRVTFRGGSRVPEMSESELFRRSLGLQRR